MAWLLNVTRSSRSNRVRPGLSALLTVVIDHGFDIPKDLTVSPVGFLSCLRKRIDTSVRIFKNTMGLRVEDEWDG